MKVVIVGPRDRKEKLYRRLVNEIVDDCINRYSKLLIITKSCDQGVGKIIRGRCLREYEIAGQTNYKYNDPEFDMVEISLRHHLIQELPQSEFQANFDSLNSALVEIGDEFHLIMEDIPIGTMFDLLKRVQSAGRPHVTYKPDELKSGPKQPKLEEVKSNGHDVDGGE